MPAPYQLTGTSAVLRVADNTYIFPDGTAWNAYHAWVLAGNTADPAPAPTLSPQQQAANVLASGTVALTSTATPDLNGTYSIAPPARDNITGVQAGIASGQGLPGGGTTFSYFDIAGVAHQFGATDFTNFAKAVRDYIYAVSLVAAGTGTTLPSNALVIP